MSQNPWTTSEVERLRVLRASGLSNSRCGVELGRSVGSVAGQVRRCGVELRRLFVRYRSHGELQRQVRRLRGRFTVSEMGDILGVSRAAIYRAIWRLEEKGKSC